MINKSLQIVILMVGLGIFMLVLGAAPNSGPNGETVQLFFTGDLYGYLKPCG